ncbi:hypothetical protein ACH7WG_003711 [Vibrio vulnificus]
MEEKANSLIVSLSGLNFALSKAIVDVLRSRNKEQYAASGFIHYGKHYTPSIAASVNEGMTCAANSPNFVAIGRATSEIAGSSKTNHAVVNMAGFTSNLITSATYSMFSIKYPEAPKGTVVYDSSGNCRGTGKPTLDLSEEIDPKYGDVAGSVNEAVARAFEGQVKNGDLRLGLSHWASYQGNSMSITNGVLSGASGSNSNTCLHQVGTTYTAGKQYKVILKNVSSNQSFTVRLAGRYIANEAKPACSNIDMEFLVTTDQTGTGLSIAGSGIGAAISFSSISVTEVTEEVVIDRVDMAGIEFFKEKVGAYLYPYGMIQNKATTVDGVATTEDTVRPITYFAVFDGDTTSRGLGWKLADLTFVQLATIMSNPEHNAWYNEAGELMQFRGRQRSFAGLGNGDWGATNIGIHPAKDRYLGFTTNTFVHSQGMLNTVTPLNSITNRIYESNVSGYTEEAGVYKVNNGSGATAVDDECYFYVLATVPRLNQGAYHQSLNPMGTKHWNRHDASGGNFWHQPNTGNNKTTARAFYQTIAVDETGARQPTGAIGQSSGRGDGRFYDAIYASGQGGVIDWRLPARDMGSKEEATKIIQQVVNGTYRGLEKLVKTTPYGSDKGAAYQGLIQGMYKWNATGPDFVISHGTLGVEGTDAPLLGWLVQEGKLFPVTYMFQTSGSDTTQIYCGKNTWERYAEGKIVTNIVSDKPLYFMHTTETNISVSGDFSQLDVIGSPAEILKVDALKNGWMGSWIPQIPDGTAIDYPMRRKHVGTSAINRQYTVNSGVSWTNSTPIANLTTNTLTSSLNVDSIQILNYTAFAKQTKPSTNKPVLNGSEGVGDVYAMDRYTTFNGASFVESLIGKVPTSASTRTYAELMLQEATKTNESKLAFVSHSPLVLDAPTNNSPAVKALWHQASSNRQATLNFLWNELVYRTALPMVTDTGAQMVRKRGERYLVNVPASPLHNRVLCWEGNEGNITVDYTSYYLDSCNVVRSKSNDARSTLQLFSGDGWGDDKTIRIVDGQSTYINLNGDTCLYGISVLAMPYGYTKNQAGAGKQVVGVDL